MRSFAPMFVLAVGAAAAWQAHAAEIAPRPVVEGVAQAIADNYYDPAKGAAVAGQLRTEAAKGAYDRLTDPRDLATTLSGRLRPLDHHFNVSWSAEPVAAPRQAPGPSAAAVPGPPRVDPVRRANYGIRRVEILNGNLGYIDMRMFAHFEFGQPDAPARKAIEAALQTVANTDAVIIDLRDNGGGSPAMVGYLASAFTPMGPTSTTPSRAARGRGAKLPGTGIRPRAWTRRSTC